jgi:hypothetical protein
VYILETEMKMLIAILALATGVTHAETLIGKKCKAKWDKATQTAEVECFSISKSEHVMVIRTVSEPPPTPPTPQPQVAP